MLKKDHCTCFPEYWITWTFKKIYIGDLCKKHDQRCGSHGFYKGTWDAHLVGAVSIATIAGLACWWKNRRFMKSKL